MKRAKRGLAAIMSICMLLSLLPAMALAVDGDSVADESTLQSRIESAEDGATIQLEKNYVESITIPDGKTLTLDLNGKTLSNTEKAQDATVAASERKSTITNNGALTITDSQGHGKVDNLSHGMAAVYNNEGGEVILSGGTFDRSAEAGKGTEDSGGNSFYTILNHGTMTIKDGVTVTQNGQYSSMIENGYQSGGAGSPKLTIEGGTFTGGLNTIKNDDRGVLEIKGGTFENVAQSAVMNWNEATIGGGTFEAEAEGASVLTNTFMDNNGQDLGKLTITGGEFTCRGPLIAFGVGGQTHGTVDISGGKFTYNGTFYTEEKEGTTSISGGTFSGDVSDYLADGVGIRKEPDGTFIVGELDEGNSVAETGSQHYATLQAAIDAVESEEQIVTLNRNTTENVTIPEDKSIVLELNGKTLSGGSDNEAAHKDKPALTNNGTVVIQDSAGGGTICRGDEGTNGYYTIDNQGVMTIESGTVCNTVGVKNQEGIISGSSLIRNAGAGKAATLTINGGDIHQDGFIVIKNDDNGILVVNGGTITGTGSDEKNTVSAVQNWGQATITGGTLTGAVWASVWSNDYPNSKTEINGADVQISGKIVVKRNDATLSKEPEVPIKDGSFDVEWSVENPEYVKVSGGQFTSDAVKAYLVPGSSLISNGDGTYSVGDVTEDNAIAEMDGERYGTLQEAINAAQTEQAVVTLLKDTTESVVVPAGKTLVLNLNGHNLTGKADSWALVVNGNLTIRDSKAPAEGPVVSADYETVTYASGKIESASSGFAVQVQNGGNLVLESGTVIATKGNGINVLAQQTPNGEPVSSSLTVKGGYVNSEEYGLGVYGNKAVLNVSGGVIVADNNAVVGGNGTVNTKTDNGGTEISLTGGTLIGHITSDGYIACGVYHPQSGKLTISNDVNIYADGGVGVLMRAGTAEITGGTITGTGTVSGGVGDKSVPVACGGVIYDVSKNTYPGLQETDKVTISENATVKATGAGVSAVSVMTEDAAAGRNRMEISGGSYSSDPSAYVVDSKIAVAADGMYGIQDKNTDTPAEVVAGEPEVEATPGIDKKVTEAVAKTEATGLTGEANGEANTNTVTVDAGKKALQEKHIDTEGKTVTIVVQPYLDIKVDSYSNTEMKLDITPMVRTVATTADVDKNGTIILEGGEKNAVVMEDPKPMNVTTNVTLRVPLPSGFRADNLYVEHAKDNGRTYLYKATVTESSGSNTATFTTRHGFSTFTLKADVSPAAEIDGTYYETLQDAVNNVQDGQTIRLEQDVSGTVTVSREVTFSIDTNEKKFNPDDIIAGSGYRVSHDGNTFTVVEESHGGSSSSGSTRYTVSVEDTDNGSVKVSPTRASKGSTVTVTVKPDEGYELDKLTVTDKNGDRIKLTDKGDGKYTFQMPASKVTVEAEFTAVEPEPEGLPFTDVTSGDWFYDAVAYVYDKGMMEGTTDTTFAPAMNLTRSMIAQVLYNLEERPEAPGAAGFPDVAAGAWYADAVNWAAARGIVKGYDTGAFGPEDSVTREQLAAILYRYAQVKGYDTTQGGMAVREFSDSASISDWAQEAMAWAVNAQVLSGKGNGVLDPQGTATRAEVAQMLMNFVEHVG